jgi:hypothetical protein
MEEKFKEPFPMTAAEATLLPAVLPWQIAEKARAQREAHMKDPSRLAKANQKQGAGFEQVMINTFALKGFSARKVDESDGFARGWDIKLKDFPLLVIQCKATKSKASLMKGLNEARSHNPSALGWVCIHSLRKEGKRSGIRVAYSSRHKGPASITDLGGFMELLIRAQLKGWYPNG